ncbi:MAG TPA: hypothetical protein VMV90_06615 [Rectinemataceae bacterium]|nr:hypothetical protein [Rectinemataceae bacterium]
MNPTKEYDARIDTKKRVTLRGARYDNYHVQEYADGRILLEPRKLVAPFELSARTLAAMDEGMKNLKKGKVSKSIDLTAFADK